MEQFSFSDFLTQFPTDAACLEEIKRQRFPRGIFCISCRRATRHYRLHGRNAYSCKFCRTQVYPLSGTLYEKSSTPLRLWFYALFLITQSRDTLPTKTLQKELGVTYKTAWRMRTHIRALMEQGDGYLLQDPAQKKERRWLFFNKLEFKVIQKHESSKDSD
jgi:Transposase zinc-ribbon domain